MTLRTILAIASLLLVTACGDKSDDNGTGGAGGMGGTGGTGGSIDETPRCGDGVVNQDDEECDGRDLPVFCEDLGFPHGAIACTATCKLDTSRCGIPDEDCSTPGDEDGDGDADCDDSDCAKTFDCPSCGNGIIQRGETCDGPASTPSCVDLGFELGSTTCSSECVLDRSACRNRACGDGIREGPELCDDGNLVDRDGCSSTCQIEGNDCSSAIALDSTWDASTGRWHTTIDMTGFASDFTPGCTDAPVTADAVTSFTAPTAGRWELSVDNRVAPAVIWAWRGTCATPEEEIACGTSGDESSVFISLDLNADETVHFAVAGAIADRNLGEVTIRATPVVCGDAIRAAAEECDDGNRVDGDGCTADCRLPGEDCLNPYDFNPWSGAYDVSRPFENDHAGSCGDTSGPEAVATYTAPATGLYEIVYVGSAPNRTLYVWDNVCGSAADEVVCTGSVKWGWIVAKVALVADQTIYIAADNAAGEAGTFTLDIGRVECGNRAQEGSEECDDGNAVDGDGCSAACVRETTNEVEPNETLATATPLVSPGRGVLASPGDSDTWSFELTAGTQYSIWTGTTRFLGSCGVDDLDTTLALYDGDGTLLAEDDDGGTGLCSRINYTPTSTGTYFAAVGMGGAESGLPTEYILRVQ